MARGIVVDLQGLKTRFDIQVVSRAKLYGEKKKQIVDERGEPTTSGWLTIDGSMLIGPGGRSEFYLDDAGDIVERDELAAIDHEGRLLEKLPSTLDVPQALTPVTPETLLDYITTNIYELTPDPNEVDPALMAELDQGAIFRTEFSYMPGYGRSPLFVLKNDEGLFALVCENAPLTALGREVPPTPPEQDDDSEMDDDLDFSLF